MSNFNEHYKIRFLTMNVTNSCNLSCNYCFEKNKDNNFMTPEDAIKIFEIGYQNHTLYYKDKATFNVSFFGGEPLLNWPAIKAVIEYAQKYENCNFGITTNLTILTNEMIEFFDEYNIGLLVSIDGIKSIHNKNRCNSYDKVKKNIKKLIDANCTRLIEVRMTMLPEDVNKTLIGIKSIINLGVNNIFPYFVTDVKWEKSEIECLKKELSRLIKFVIKIAEDENNTRNISIKNIEDAICACQTTKYTNNIPCVMGDITNVSVDYNGNIMPCHQRHYNDNLSADMCVGNILDDKIFSDNILGKMQSGHNYSENDENDCSECKAFPLCKGWCPSENIDFRDNAYCVPEMICSYNNIMFELIEKYQQKILSAKNLRSRKLNILKLNLELDKKFEKLKTISITERKFLIKLMEFQSDLVAQSELIFSDFMNKFIIELNILTELLREIKEVSINGCTEKQ